MRTSNTPHRIWSAILFVIGMEDIKHSQSALEHRIRLILQLGSLEHHVEEVALVTQIIVRIGILHPDAMTKSKGGYSGHFCNEPINLFPTTFDIEDFLRVGIKRRERSQRGFKHAHWVCVVMKTIDYFFDTFIYERVIGDVLRPLFQFRLIGKFAVEQEISNLEVGTFFGKLIDGITTIFEDPFITVDKCDSALTGGGVH